MPATAEGGTVRDFGEYLVDVREQVEGPLPIRVVQWRVFLAFCLEGFCLGYIRLLSRHFRSSMEDRYGLTNPTQDFNHLRATFGVLEGREGSREQMLQAHEAFLREMQRRMMRSQEEIERWGAAAQSGQFLGILFYCLSMMTALMAGLTDRTLVFLVALVVFLLLQLSVSIICLKGWHRS